MVLRTMAQPAPNERVRYRGEMSLQYRDLVWSGSGGFPRPATLLCRQRSI